MKIDRYPLRSEKSSLVFEFTSEGPKGQIRKVIQFEQTRIPNLFNPAFGDIGSETQELQDLTISNNGDSEKVLATVVSALYVFFEAYPDSYVYATGSTRARTRLYRMGITRYFDAVVQDFELFGQVGNTFVPFEIGKDYAGFLAIRKKNYLASL